MGPGSSTLRIDEPLHLMFLLAYLITYFCCAYILFLCFKNCRRLVQRKPPRPVANFSRLSSIAEAMYNLPCRPQSSSRTSGRHVQVSLRNVTGTHTALCPAYEEDEDHHDMSQSQLSVSDTAETSTSMLSPLRMTTLAFRRMYYNQHNSPITCLIVTGDDELDTDDYDDELPQYDSVSTTLQQLPPSYSECVLSSLTHAPELDSASSVPCGVIVAGTASPGTPVAHTALSMTMSVLPDSTVPSLGTSPTTPNSHNDASEVKILIREDEVDDNNAKPY